MKVSVIIPVYNVEEYLQECIDSLLKQDYLDYELILIDDGSPDESGQFCDEYAEKHAHIHVIHQKNGGVSAARNAGLRIATGEYIAFVDPDDWVEPDFLSLLIKNMRPNSMVICDFVRERTSEEKSGASMKDTELDDIQPITLTKGEAQAATLCPNQINGSVCNKLFDGDIIRRYALCFSENLSRGEDELFVIQYLSYTSQPIIWVRGRAYHYRIRTNSAMRGQKRRKQFHIRYISLPAGKERLYVEQTPELLRRVNMREIASKAAALHEMKLNHWEKCEYYKPYLQDVRHGVISYLRYDGGQNINEKILVALCSVSPQLERWCSLGYRKIRSMLRK